MANLKVKYLGLDLDNPIIIGSSPFTATVEKIKQMEAGGAGAVVLKSIFEEQIVQETTFLEQFNSNSRAAGYGYLESYVGNDYIKRYLELVADVKKSVGIPVIASINCMHSGNWAAYAKMIESAGADALELNIFILPTSVNEKSQDIEKRYLDVVASVTQSVGIPVSVKLGMRFTNMLLVIKQMYNRGCKGVVLFNRFFEPDVDTETLSMVPSDPLSENSELRNSLRSTALCTSAVPTVDVAVSTGVHSGEDVVKSLLVGAKAVQICSTIYKNGSPVIDQIKGDVAKWMELNSFLDIAEFTGRLSYNKPGEESDLYQRSQYMKFFPK